MHDSAFQQKIEVYTKVKEAIECYINPGVNEPIKCFLLNQRVQEKGETFEHFLTLLQELVKKYNYNKTVAHGENAYQTLGEWESKEDKMLRDQVRHRIGDKAVQEALLHMDNLTLEKAATHIRMWEQNRRKLIISTKLMRRVTVVHTRAEETRLGFSVWMVSVQAWAQGMPCICLITQKAQTNHYIVTALTRVNVLEFKGKGQKDLTYLNEWHGTIDVENKKPKFKLDTGAQVSVSPFNIFRNINQQFRAH
ncbi:hypothetical protein PR048_011761 [Dryococelus australis]|uniref:Uncharacterized protein n=1 Tax=Dryococelus australis TaxID=614101 RepID=A0ABQ9HNS4_9NEOP|nr:hypothetical protein PR048_011761 [Dryococelus australis]